MLDQLCATIWQIRANLSWEKSFQLLHGGINNLLVTLAHPIGLAAGNWRARSKHQLQHRFVLILVLLAAGAHVRINGEEWASAEAQVVHVKKLPIEPKVDVDDRNAFQFIDLAEERVRRPSSRKYALHNVAWHGRDVLVCDHLLAVTHQVVADRAVVIGFNAGNGLVQQHLAATRLNVLLQRLTESVRLVAVQECHLQAVRLVEETVHGCEDNSHGELLRVDEVQGLGHGDEDLCVNPVRHAILLHEVEDGKFVLEVNELLAFHEHREQSRGGLQLLRQRQHLLIKQDGQAEVEGSWNALQEIKGGELSRQLLHGKDHLMALPLQAVLDVQLFEEVHHVGVSAEEDVETCLDPISVFVLPC
mmetsp:Transcript_48507/g.90907  ORF Transcript_48507/g.90907 Transcript_48507/m.90907 type:complete len:361 (+) Transcript_48507:550-1632(+)